MAHVSKHIIEGGGEGFKVRREEGVYRGSGGRGGVIIMMIYPVI